MSSYQTRLTNEEGKRQKRLARNRASARLRRQKKKNLVDSYECEVGILEAGLMKLRAHKWGSESSSPGCESLLEALSMDRGQQNLPTETRNQLVLDILSQQSDQVRNLIENQMELMTLTVLAQSLSNTGEISQEEKELCDELQDVLCLSDAQRSQILHATDPTALSKDHTALSTIDQVLSTLLQNQYFLSPEIENTFDQFLSILNPSQISKLMLWTDHNSDAIDELDYVHAPREVDLPVSSPRFVFGVEEGDFHREEGDDKDRH